MVIKQKHGKRYLHEPKPGCFYVRKGGKYVPIRTGSTWHQPGTADFDRVYWDILTGRAAEAKRSWAAAIKVLMHSERWASKSSRYRQDLEPVFAYIIEKIGNRDVAKLTAPDIYAAMDANQHRVRFANYIPVAISMIAKEVMRKRWLTANPAIGIERLTVPKDRRKEHIPWPDWAVDKFRADAGDLELLIFEVGTGTVQRPSDWLEFTWGDYDGHSLMLTQGKGGVRLVLPCTDALKAALDAAKARLPVTPHPSAYIITTTNGGQMTYRQMAAIMLAERRRLGVEKYDLHAMRYRGVQELAWHGCDDDEIMSYSGHATKAMVIKYAQEARQIMRARQAHAKRR